MLYNKSRDPAELVCSKATVGHERHRLQPELGHIFPFSLVLSHFLKPLLTVRGPRHAERGDVLRYTRRDLAGIRRFAGSLADAGADEDNAVDNGWGRG